MGALLLRATRIVAGSTVLWTRHSIQEGSGGLAEALACLRIYNHLTEAHVTGADDQVVSSPQDIGEKTRLHFSGVLVFVASHGPLSTGLASKNGKRNRIAKA